MPGNVFRAVSLVLLALAGFFPPQQSRAQGVTLTHIHGLVYSADGKRIFIPSHHGLAVYDGSRWSKAPGPQHDYMGFSATRDAVYSSGHPAPGSGLKEPFGLIKSKDAGQNWQHLGLTGESDFHVLATSYRTNAIYVFTEHLNSRMRQPGMYFTRDDGKTWQRSAANGLRGAVTALAVHPADPAVVAAGTKTGLYLSRDHGARFEPVITNALVASVFFALQGQELWYGSFDGRPVLTRMNLKSGEKAAVKLPPMEQDAVAYIAQNPAQPAEWAIATFKKDVYVSRDRGGFWRQIARGGKTF